MRQQKCANAALRDTWAAHSQRCFRLNPKERSLVFKTEMCGSALVGETSVEFDETITFKGVLRCGLTTRVTCNPSTLRGVAARLNLSGEDQVFGELILLHRDPSLNIIVARTCDMDALCADWQIWAKRFSLSLILIEPDGVEQIVKGRFGCAETGSPISRRPHIHSATRRPRFLVKRKVGQAQVSQKMVAGREIIARR